MTASCAPPYDADWIVPEGLPAGVGAVMTTRAGGTSAPPWASFNLGSAVGDDPAAVQHNRKALAGAIRGRPVFLRQVHGARVLRLSGPLPADDSETADACVTSVPSVACAIQVADCLPVLLAAPDGRGVGGAHAGWRGLAGGVVEACVAALCDTSGSEPSQLWAWLGPCIGPRQFEVGAEVRAAFNGDEAFFEPSPAVEGVPKWHADLAGLARARLRRIGVSNVGGGTWCTASDPSRFFSFRRDRVCGRLAAAIWLDG